VNWNISAGGYAGQINGLRIELGEIEKQMEALPG
jgi:hypothetical protein